MRNALEALALQRADEQMDGFTWDESSFHRLCFHLDEHGRPCNRKVMRPFSFCSEHREKPKTHDANKAEHQRRWKANRQKARNEAGVASGMEAM